jgi:hypothetical protein
MWHGSSSHYSAGNLKYFPSYLIFSLYLFMIVGIAPSQRVGDLQGAGD